MFSIYFLFICSFYVFLCLFCLCMYFYVFSFIYTAFLNFYLLCPYWSYIVIFFTDNVQSYAVSQLPSVPDFFFRRLPFVSHFQRNDQFIPLFISRTDTRQASKDKDKYQGDLKSGVICIRSVFT